MARKRPITWAEVGYRNAGMRGVFRALTFTIRWAACMAVLGREPETIDEFCEVLGEAERTAYRDQQAFRKAFPTELTPLRLVEQTDMAGRFREAIRRFDDIERAQAEMAPMAFSVGATPFSPTPG